MNDVEQTLAAMEEGELRGVLQDLVTALHAENTDECYPTALGIGG